MAGGCGLPPTMARPTPRPLIFMQASPAPPFSTPLAKLQQRLIQKEAVIGIYGLGYVGLPLALRFAEVGLRVIGFDIDPAKVSILNAGAAISNA